MKILFLCDYLVQSGSVSSMLGLMQGLKGSSHALRIITFGGGRTDEFTRNEISVKKVKKYRFSLSFFRRFSKVIEVARSFAPGIIQVESPSLFKGGYKLGSILNIPLVFTVNRYLRRKDFLSQQKMDNVTIITVSQALREYLVNTIKLKKENIQVVRSGIELSWYEDGHAFSKEAIPSVGMCGSYVKERGHECFLDAVKVLIDKGRDVLFFVSGYGKGEKKIKKKAHQLGLSGNVTFILDFPDLRKVLALYDILIIPSRKEGLGFRALEAMAMGKPVIAASVGGLMDVVRDEETGLLFQPGNSEKLAEKIECLLDNPEVLQGMGERGKEIVEKEFPVENMVQKVIEVYDSLVTEHTVRWKNPNDRT